LAVEFNRFVIHSSITILAAAGNTKTRCSNCSVILLKYKCSNVTVTIFCACTTNLPAKPTDSIANGLNSIAKAMNSTVNGMKPTAKMTNSIAEK